MNNMRKQADVPDLLSPVYWNSTIKMSLSKFFILCVLNEQDLHGYDIAKEVERRTDGCCSPREGTIYPVLKQFTEGGYVTFESEIVSGRERKIYTITQTGREAFKVGLGEWMKITRALEDCVTMIEKRS
ncbi:PadR family transcriptional regulator [Pelagibius sp. Alg239-R121]|uniref:PadR family transcriptional regulator n=1 Tax=Pelagibius sp. Alg239-R121 TaxID=2993448 RepID=UPI0024A7235F|nr:PadR family transcriptional regulator [Pelagibius sp. Alg239-R121]